jgi:hypothetical protein
MYGNQCHHRLPSRNQRRKTRKKVSTESIVRPSSVSGVRWASDCRGRRSWMVAETSIIIINRTSFSLFPHLILIIITRSTSHHSLSFSSSLSPSYTITKGIEFSSYKQLEATGNFQSQYYIISIPRKCRRRRPP